MEMLVCFKTLICSDLRFWLKIFNVFGKGGIVDRKKFPERSLKKLFYEVLSLLKNDVLLEIILQCS